MFVSCTRLGCLLITTKVMYLMQKKPKTAEEMKFTQLFSAEVTSEYQSTAVTKVQYFVFG